MVAFCLGTSCLGRVSSKERGGLSEVLVGPGGQGLFCPEPGRNFWCVHFAPAKPGSGRGLSFFAGSPPCSISSFPLFYASFSNFSFPSLPEVTATEIVAVINTLLGIDDRLCPKSISCRCPHWSFSASEDSFLI